MYRDNCHYRFAPSRLDDGWLTGTLLTFGDVYNTPWAESERIERGAFGNLAEADVVLNVLHDRTRPVCRTGGGGLELEDVDGVLRLRARLPDTTDGRDARTLIEAGVLRGLSIEALYDDCERVGNCRVVRRARLVGAGIVDTPAYPQSLIDARMKAHAAPRRSHRWR